MLLQENWFQETAFLAPEEPVIFPARGMTDPVEFANRPHIRMLESFWRCIVPVLRPVAYAPERMYVAGRFKRTGCLRNRFARDRCMYLEIPRVPAHWEDLVSLTETRPQKRCRYLLFLEGVGGEIFPISAARQYVNWTIFPWKPKDDGCYEAGERLLLPSDELSLAHTTSHDP